MKTKESDLVGKVGLDAAIFMRFTRMMRNMFTALTIVGCAILIPTALIGAGLDVSGFNALTPTGLEGATLWAYVVVAYLFDGIIFYFLWANYRAILRLRRAYFDSTDYQRSLHSRTLMMTDIPKNLRSDDGIVKIAEEVKASGDVPRAAIARNVKDLPELIEEHEEMVKSLENILAKYLKNPDHLPAKRPTCKASKNDKAYKKGEEVDAIEYLTTRIKELETEIKEVRLQIDKRDALSYGFATYESISEAHGTAYAARKKGPEGTIIRLAPKPNDLIWKNLKLLKKERGWQNFINNLWVALLTVVWVAPNVLIAVFLSNLKNVGAVWPAFQTSLYAHPTIWALVQGIVSPAITTLFYYFLPSIFRQLVTRAGDVTRTGRERHVMHKLFSFFVFNNLIVFSLFSAIWTYVSLVIHAAQDNESAWDAVEDNHPFQHVVSGLITVTPYWCSWLLQRNLGAAIDLSQLVRLFWGTFSRRYLNPTPRSMIELTAPQPFEYAGYYNYFCFYAAVALCFGSLQPVALAITALYFWMDSFSKKYMLLYIFITKYESGGMFWRTLFNRILVAAVLGNIVTALLVVTHGGGYSTSGIDVNWGMLAAMAPLILLVGGFKWYCARTFDDQIHYYQKGHAMRDDELLAGEQKRRKGDRVGVRFGHPALYKPLITPMVSAKSQHLLKQVYSGRTSMDDTGTVAGYSDVYLDAMDVNKPGKSAGSAPFEIVHDHEMDYENWKDRPEFRDQYGGDGELYGRPQDMIRPGTPSTMMTGPTRTGTWDSSYSRSRSESRDPHFRDRSDSEATKVESGVEYPRGYHHTPNLREESPAPSEYFGRVPRQSDKERLVQSAARMGRSEPPQLPTLSAPSPGGYGPIRVSMTPRETPGEDTSYDYFRRDRGL